MSVSMQASNSEEVFTKIYSKGIWGKDKNGKGTSGGGSSVKNATPYMKFLEDFIKEKKIESIVDVGCGDWSFSQFIDWNDSSYWGIDVVKPVIDNNINKYSSDKICFSHGDILDMELPDGDLLICKDVLQHLSNENILRFLEKIKKFKHCLITNDVFPKTLTSPNKDLGRDTYHKIDLTKSPFNIDGVNLFTFKCGHATKQVLHITHDL